PPLYSPEAMRLTTWSTSPGPATVLRRDRVRERLPRLASAYRRLLPALRRLAGRDRRLRRPFSGYGYQFEALEVLRCLTRGDKESSTMPLDESVAVLEIVDRVRCRA
ncbi:MAG: hypothetical protein L0191_07550, partial [Acidobacteria bacterium]|nr:hypothetical protein [Acidobacteriota bacterium]